MAYTVFTKPRALGDLVRAIFHPSFNYVSAKIVNPDAEVTLTDPLGLPVKLNGTDWELVNAADIANATGILLEDKGIPTIASAGTTEDKYLILRRGPAVIHEDMLPEDDHLGDEINQTNFITRLAALDIVVMTGATLEELQTT